MCKHATWDELLAYPTVKIVKVKDRYLGGIRYVLMIAIFAYIIGYVILWEKGYNICQDPEGSIELSLRKPPGLFDPRNYSYCTQNPDAIPAHHPQWCVVVDERDVYQPVDQTSAMYITTRFNSTYQEPNPNCTRGGPCDVPWVEVPSLNVTNRTYSANIETFTIRFSHFFQARQFYLKTRDDYYSQAGSEMKGKLVNVHGDTLATYGNDAADIISLGKILEAANVELDDLSAYPPATEANETNRYAGLVLFFGIDYQGTYDNPVEYTYSITQVPAVEYKVTRSTMVNFNSRLITDTHGVKIFFVFSGSICRFDFQTMLINMVAGLGLLSVATLTTDFLMEYLMPLKEAYIKYKYRETEHHDKLWRKVERKRQESRKLSDLLSDVESHSEIESVRSINQVVSKDKSADHYRPLTGDEDEQNGHFDTRDLRSSCRNDFNNQ